MLTDVWTSTTAGRAIAGCGLCLALLLAAAMPAAAQPFGRNKVRYDGFKFEILQTPHFEIYYYPGEREAVVQAGRMAERWYDTLSHTFNHKFGKRQPIILYGSHAQFTQTNVVAGFISDGVTGVTEHERGRVVLPFAIGLGETDHVLGHELVHAFQRDILRVNGRAMTLLPLWFLEGMAESLSIGHIDANTAMWIRDAVRTGQLPRIDQLDDPRWFPYRYGQALWVYLADRFGEDIATRALHSKAAGGGVGRLMDVTGLDVKTLSDGWHAWMREQSGPKSGSPADGERAIVTSVNGGRLNLGPSISPDGRSLVFLSERDQYSIDVFLADATNGDIERKLIQVAGDPHFDSLQFVESAGAWNARGTRFALAALSRGEPVITILRMPEGTVERELKIHEVDQIFDPSWSPDGRYLAFAALSGGWTDLFVVDLSTAVVRRLTHDAFADIQPAWSPDSTTLAFATDRFSSSIESLTFGEFALATLDVKSGRIDALPVLPGGRNIDPQWSGDGREIYFVADTGASASNVYCLSLPTGRITRVTNQSVGVSGITALSPSLSIAPDANRLAFSVYRDHNYEIHTLELATPLLTASPLSVTPAEAPAAVPTLADLTTRAPRQKTPASAFVDDGLFTTKPYRSGLSLERTVQPYLTAGGGATGRFLRGGIGLQFGDMLGDQQLNTVVQAGASRDDFSAQAAYINLRNRWNWGLAGGEVPWLFGGGETPLTVDGNGTLIRASTTYRQLHRTMSALTVYPLNGARRIELTGGVEWIGLERRVSTSRYSPTTGVPLGDPAREVDTLDSATLVPAGIALVHDTSIWGATSPILGRRFRLAAAPTVGSVDFFTLTADYRAYLMPRHDFTIALRAMHLGRYGGGIGDLRILPMAWTIRDLVRGYGDYGPADTVSYTSARQIAIGNAELRVPLSLLGGHTVTSLPIEAFAFADAGHFTIPSLVTAARSARTLMSVGGGARLNAAGSIFQVGVARQLGFVPGGWAFVFDVRPGF